MSDNERQDLAVDQERRRVLKMIGAGGAVLLLPLDGQADDLNPPEPADRGIEARTDTMSGTANRVVKRATDVPAMDGNGARVVVDVHKNSRGDVTVHWGTGALTNGTGATLVTVQTGSSPHKTIAAGVTTLTLTYQVKIDAAGAVSVITPGGNPD